MISVIVPIYNVENYLKKCIVSILGQSYKDFELILVNDGSTDESGNICDEYKQIDSRIKVVHKENGGLSDARNCGLDIACGDYIAFIDSDDWIDASYYSRLYNLVEKYHADIAICNFKKVYTENDKLNDLDDVIVYSNMEALQQVYNEKYVQMIIACNKLYKKKIFRDIWFPIGKIHEDEYTIPILLYRANRIVYTNKELYYYRQTPNSITNSEFSIRKLDYLYALENRRKFFCENNLKLLFIKTIYEEILTIINFYSKVKISNIDNKDKVMEELKIRLYELNRCESINISNRYKLKIGLFKISPYLYEQIYNNKNNILRLLNSKNSK